MIQKDWVPLGGLLLTGLYVILQLLQWRKHGDDLMGTAASIVTTALLWTALAVAISYYWKDSRRAKSLRAQIVTIKDDQATQNEALINKHRQETNRLSAELRKQTLALEERDREHNSDLEELRKRYEKQLGDARRPAIIAATWGIGGRYSREFTKQLMFFLERFKGPLQASEEVFGDAGYPGDAKVLAVRFTCPCSGTTLERSFKEGEVVDLKTPCFSTFDVVTEVENKLSKVPHLLVNYCSGAGESLTVINDGDATAIVKAVGPLRWNEQRPISFLGPISPIPAGSSEECQIVLEGSPGHRYNLYDFMRESTPHTANTSVVLTFDDTQGNRFNQRFSLTTTVRKGVIVWEPGPVTQAGEARE